MSRFIESIKILDGRIMNLEYHQLRFNFTRKTFFPDLPEFDLAGRIRIPPDYLLGLFKCRLVYGKRIEKIEFIPYHKPVIRTLKTIVDDDIDYNFKYENRHALNRLWEKRDNLDDVIIVKHNLVTDSSYSNIVFLKKGYWYTPGQPLLKGTMRERLLSRGKIKEKEIHADEIRTFEKIGLINAMNELGECMVDIGNVN